MGRWAIARASGPQTSFHARRRASLIPVRPGETGADGDGTGHSRTRLRCSVTTPGAQQGLEV